MALLNGKQLRNTSTSLDKLNGSGVVVFTSATVSFATGSKLIISDSNITLGTDVVNKNYVDSRGTASGTLNYIPKFTSINTFGNSLIYDDGSLIGFNTSTQLSSLSNYLVNINGSIAYKTDIIMVAQNESVYKYHARIFEYGDNGYIHMARFGQIDSIINLPADHPTPYIHWSDGRSGGVSTGSDTWIGPKATPTGVINDLQQYGLAIRSNKNIGFSADSGGHLMINLDTNGNLSIGTSSTSYRLSVVTSGTQSNGAYQVKNAADTSLLYGNESGTNFNAANGGLYVLKSNPSYGLNGTFIGNDSNTNYAPLDIGIYGIGAFISLSHTTQETIIWTSTTIGGSSRGNIGYSARVGISGDGTLGLRNIGFLYNGNNGNTIYAIGNEDDLLNTTIRIKNVPTQFGYSGMGPNSESNNSWRVGIGTSSISTHRVVISEGLKVIGTYSGGGFMMVDGTQGNGKLLVSDTNGIGTWQSVGTSSGIGSVNKFSMTSNLVANIPIVATHSLLTTDISVVVWDDNGQISYPKIDNRTINTVNITSTQNILNARIIVTG